MGEAEVGSWKYFFLLGLVFGWRGRGAGSRSAEAELTAFSCSQDTQPTLLCTQFCLRSFGVAVQFTAHSPVRSCRGNTYGEGLFGNAGEESSVFWQGCTEFTQGM